VSQDCLEGHYFCPIDDTKLELGRDSKFRCSCCGNSYGLPSFGEKMDLERWARGYLITLSRQLPLVREPEIRESIRRVLQMGVEKGLVLVEVDSLVARI